MNCTSGCGGAGAEPPVEGVTPLDAPPAPPVQPGDGVGSTDLMPLPTVEGPEDAGPSPTPLPMPIIQPPPEEGGSEPPCRCDGERSDRTCCCCCCRRRDDEREVRPMVPDDAFATRPGLDLSQATPLTAGHGGGGAHETSSPPALVPTDAIERRRALVPGLGNVAAARILDRREGLFESGGPSYSFPPARKAPPRTLAAPDSVSSSFGIRDLAATAAPVVDEFIGPPEDGRGCCCSETSERPSEAECCCCCECDGSGDGDGGEAPSPPPPDGSEIVPRDTAPTGSGEGPAGEIAPYSRRPRGPIYAPGGGLHQQTPVGTIVGQDVCEVGEYGNYVSPEGNRYWGCPFNPGGVYGPTPAAAAAQGMMFFPTQSYADDPAGWYLGGTYVGGLWVASATDHVPPAAWDGDVLDGDVPAEPPVQDEPADAPPPPPALPEVPLALLDQGGTETAPAMPPSAAPDPMPTLQPPPEEGGGESSCRCAGEKSDRKCCFCCCRRRDDEREVRPMVPDDAFATRPGLDLSQATPLTAGHGGGGGAHETSSPTPLVPTDAIERRRALVPGLGNVAAARVLDRREGLFESLGPSYSFPPARKAPPRTLAAPDSVASSFGIRDLAATAAPVVVDEDIPPPEDGRGCCCSETSERPSEAECCCCCECDGSGERDRDGDEAPALPPPDGSEIVPRDTAPTGSGEGPAGEIAPYSRRPRGPIYAPGGGLHHQTPVGTIVGQDVCEVGEYGNYVSPEGNRYWGCPFNPGGVYGPTPAAAAAQGMMFFPTQRYADDPAGWYLGGTYVNGLWVATASGLAPRLQPALSGTEPPTADAESGIQAPRTGPPAPGAPAPGDAGDPDQNMSIVSYISATESKGWSTCSAVLLYWRHWGSSVLHPSLPEVAKRISVQDNNWKPYDPNIQALTISTWGATTGLPAEDPRLQRVIHLSTANMHRLTYAKFKKLFATCKDPSAFHVFVSSYFVLQPPEAFVEIEVRSPGNISGGTRRLPLYAIKALIDDGSVLNPYLGLYVTPWLKLVSDEFDERESEGSKNTLAQRIRVRLGDEILIRHPKSASFSCAVERSIRVGRAKTSVVAHNNDPTDKSLHTIIDLPIEFHLYSTVLNGKLLADIGDDRFPPDSRPLMLPFSATWWDRPRGRGTAALGIDDDSELFEYDTYDFDADRARVVFSVSYRDDNARRRPAGAPLRVQSTVSLFRESGLDSEREFVKEIMEQVAARLAPAGIRPILGVVHSESGRGLPLPREALRTGRLNVGGFTKDGKLDKPSSSLSGLAIRRRQGALSVFVIPVPLGGGHAGYAFPRGGNSLPEEAARGLYEDFVVLPADSETNSYTLGVIVAHELMHLLLDRLHGPGDPDPSTYLFATGFDGLGTKGNIGALSSLGPRRLGPYRSLERDGTMFELRANDICIMRANAIAFATGGRVSAAPPGCPSSS